MYRAQAIRKGNKETLKETIKGDAEKLKTTWTHATMNDAAIAIAGYNWYKRSQAVTSYALPNTNLWLSMAALGLSFYGAYLGGHLVSYLLPTGYHQV